MSQEAPRLVAAGDDISWLYQANADDYAKYLRDVWERNFNNQHLRSNWAIHYRQMREALIATLIQLLVRKEGKIGTVNAAIVGPGLDPADRDISPEYVRHIYSQFSRLAVIDFSSDVIRSAAQSLVCAGMPAERLSTLQHDLTDGMSTAYAAWVTTNLEDGRRREAGGRPYDEEAFLHTLEDMDDNMMVEIKALLFDMLHPEGATHKSTHELRPVGELRKGSNVTVISSLRLSQDGDPVQLDHIYLPFVLAGMGIIAEQLLWAEFNRVTAETDRKRGAPPDENLVVLRKCVMGAIHDVIAKFNTDAATVAITKLLTAHRSALLLAVTDTTTRSKCPPYHNLVLPRLDEKALIAKLRKEQGIVCTEEPVGAHEFQDDPSHSHDVRSLVFANANGDDQPIVT